jgi:hypothetical protein
MEINYFLDNQQISFDQISDIRSTVNIKTIKIVESQPMVATVQEETVDDLKDQTEVEGNIETEDTIEVQENIETEGTIEVQEKIEPEEKLDSARESVRESFWLRVDGKSHI